MCWKLDDEKRLATLRAVREAFFARSVTTKELQSLNGRINDIATMYPMLKVFRYELNKALSAKLENGDTDSRFAARSKRGVELLGWISARSQSVAQDQPSSARSASVPDRLYLGRRRLPHQLQQQGQTGSGLHRDER
jgi:hypothetical protein